MANAISQNQSQVPNSLPSQAFPNPNANGKNVSAITLRSGKQTVGLTQLEEPNSEGLGAILRHKEKTWMRQARQHLSLLFLCLSTEIDPLQEYDRCSIGEGNLRSL